MLFASNYVMLPHSLVFSKIDKGYQTLKFMTICPFQGLEHKANLKDNPISKKGGKNLAPQHYATKLFASDLIMGFQYFG